MLWMNFNTFIQVSLDMADWAKRPWQSCSISWSQSQAVKYVPHNKQAQHVTHPITVRQCSASRSPVLQNKKSCVCQMEAVQKILPPTWLSGHLDLSVCTCVCVCINMWQEVHKLVCEHKWVSPCVFVHACVCWSTRVRAVRVCVCVCMFTLWTLAAFWMKDK